MNNYADVEKSGNFLVDSHDEFQDKTYKIEDTTELLHYILDSNYEYDAEEIRDIFDEFAKKGYIEIAVGLRL